MLLPHSAADFSMKNFSSSSSSRALASEPGSSPVRLAYSEMSKSCTSAPWKKDR